MAFLVPTFVYKTAWIFPGIDILQFQVLKTSKGSLLAEIVGSAGHGSKQKSL